jgi:hypothetical protein
MAEGEEAQGQKIQGGNQQARARTVRGYDARAEGGNLRTKQNTQTTNERDVSWRLT